ncbi:MAG: type II secretion system protein [Gammaproteobacteria bacterium]|nr:type II secretion system protein [Gammaproteobacteria bacterium]
MKSMGASHKKIQSGFTLVEIAIVLLIVTILLGYTVALFPRQQQLKQYRALDRQMDEVIEAVIGYAQVNGRLPCPSIPNSLGLEDYDDTNNDGCDNYGGFVPMNTLGLNGRLNEDSLLLDPWGNPYRYYVTDVDFPTSGTVGNSDFTSPGEMRAVGLVDSDNDTYIDLDGRYIICKSAVTATNRCAGGPNTVFGRFQDGNGDLDDHDATDRYGGAPFVLVSMGKNWNEAAVAGDELVNSGAKLTTAFPTPIPNGPAGTSYLLKDVGSRETTFVRRPTGFADDYDDVVRWVSPNILFSRMIQAGQLP